MRTRERLTAALPWVALAAYLAFAYGAGHGSYIRIHDVLDEHVPQLALLAARPFELGDLGAFVPELLGGVPRSCMTPSEPHLMLVLYRLCDPLVAYALNDLIIRVVALVGMTLLLRRHVIPDAPAALAHGVATAFALLPYYQPIFWTLAAQPLLLSALLDLRAGTRIRSAWVVVLVYPLGATLFVNAVSLLPAIGLWVVWEGVRQRRVPWRLVVALVALAALHGLVHYRQVLLALFPGDFVSHRVERQQPVLTLWSTVKRAGRNFLLGQDHAQSAHTLGALGATAAAGFVMLRTRTQDRRVLATLATCAALSVLYAVFSWMRGAIGAMPDSPLGVLVSLDVSRAHFLHPLAWHVLLALAGAFVLRSDPSRSWATPVVAVLVALQIATAVALSDPATERREDYPVSYAEFVAAPLFADLREALREETGMEPEEYRVASLGLYPEQALMGGFRTVDGYLNTYPLEHKHAMRRVNRQELEKGDDRLRWFATGFGSRCYVLSSELGWRFRHTKQQAVRVELLEVDTEALRALGARFVLSSVEVADPQRLGWTVLGVFERDEAPWRITVYDLGR